SGAMGATCGAGVPIADGGRAPGIGVGLGGGDASEPPEVSPPVAELPPSDEPPKDEPPPTDDLAEKPDAAPPPPPPWAAACWGNAAANKPAVAAARAVVRISSMVHLPMRWCPNGKRTTAGFSWAARPSHLRGARVAGAASVCVGKFGAGLGRLPWRIR